MSNRGRGVNKEGVKRLEEGAKSRKRRAGT